MLKSYALRWMIFVFFFSFFHLSYSQDLLPLIDEYLSNQVEETSLRQGDIQAWEITDQFTSRHNEITHVHIRQLHQGIPVYDGIANITIKKGEILHMAERLQQNLAGRAVSSVPSITPLQAIHEAAIRLELGTPAGVFQTEEKSSNSYMFSKGNISQEDIPVRLMYTSGPEGELFLVWDLSGLYTR